MAAVHEERGVWDSRWRGRARPACAALVAALLLSGLAHPAAAASAAVIPLPASITLASGHYTIDAGTDLQAAPGEQGAKAAASYFAELVRRTRGLSLAVRSGGARRGAIRFEHRDGLAAEGYRLEISAEGVTVAASTATGLFYGAVTLWELLPTGRGRGQLQAQRIEDEPVYPWRGLMLDSARHFQSPAFVKSMLDWMAWHKLNVLHWHLTDDQGWRLQIRKYPRLTAIGAWRTPASVGGAALPAYGGFYTQREVREIVAFAASRHIMVIPEIDMPGHAQAAIAAYPALGSLDGPAPPVSARWGVHTYLYNLEPATFTFLEDVLSEVMELFPAPYIHLGGDEAVKDQWRASAQVQARARELGIQDPDALQGYFTQRMGQFLAAHGRRMVGWDEILRPELASDAVVMAWHGTTGAHAAAIAGHDAVLTPWPTFYFDNRQSALPDEPPGRTRVISLEEVYRFDPNDPTLSVAQQQHVLGVQGNLWTEHIRTEQRLEWMALPRAAAIAELGWSRPERRDWSDFLARLAASVPRYKSLGLNAADSAFAVDARIAGTAAGATVTLANQAHFGEIHYTLDGGKPSAASARYTTPLAVALGAEIRAATFAADEQVSHTWQQRIDNRSLARRNSRQLELCTDAVGLLLEPRREGAQPTDTVAIDIMNPCWWYRGVELDHGARLTAAVAPLPFNYELGDELKKIRVGHAQTPFGELEVHIDSCTGAAAALMPLSEMPVPAVLASTVLAPQPGVHDLCLRIARPALEPLWALDWMEIGE
jgi:hexosaminidase